MEVIMTIENFEKDFIGAIRMILSKMTEREMGKRSGVASSYLNSLKNGKKLPRALSVETLLKLFPNAQITLNAENATSGNYSPVVNGKQSVGINNGTIHNCGQSVEAFRHKIQDEIIRADVDSESKVKILNIILNTDAK